MGAMLLTVDIQLGPKAKARPGEILIGSGDRGYYRHWYEGKGRAACGRRISPIITRSVPVDVAATRITCPQCKRLASGA